MLFVQLGAKDKLYIKMNKKKKQYRSAYAPSATPYVYIILPNAAKIRVLKSAYQLGGPKRKPNK